MPPASSSLEAQWPALVAAVSAAIDLEATARASGALVRRRAIRSAEMLLRLALAYGPGGLSLGGGGGRRAAAPRGGRAADPGPAGGATAADRGWQHDRRPRGQAEVATAR